MDGRLFKHDDKQWLEMFSSGCTQNLTTCNHKLKCTHGVLQIMHLLNKILCFYIGEINILGQNICVYLMLFTTQGKC